jgi:hypothetical protein
MYREYTEFTRAALGSSNLHFKEVEVLIQRKTPEIMVSKVDFLAVITSKYHELSKDKQNHSETSEYVDFKLFVNLLYDLFKRHDDLTKSKQGGWSFIIDGPNVFGEGIH